MMKNKESPVENKNSNKVFELMDQGEELQKISAQFVRLMEEKREIIHEEEQLKTLRFSFYFFRVVLFYAA